MLHWCSGKVLSWIRIQSALWFCFVLCFKIQPAAKTLHNTLVGLAQVVPDVVCHPRMLRFVCPSQLGFDNILSIKLNPVSKAKYHKWLRHLWKTQSHSLRRIVRCSNCLIYTHVCFWNYSCRVLWSLWGCEQLCWQAHYALLWKFGSHHNPPPPPTHNWCRTKSVSHFSLCFPQRFQKTAVQAALLIGNCWFIAQSWPSIFTI